MKKVFIVVAFILGLVSCSSKTTQEQNAKNTLVPYRVLIINDKLYVYEFSPSAGRVCYTTYNHASIWCSK